MGLPRWGSVWDRKKAVTFQHVISEGHSSVFPSRAHGTCNYDGDWRMKEKSVYIAWQVLLIGVVVCKMTTVIIKFCSQHTNWTELNWRRVLNTTGAFILKLAKRTGVRKLEFVRCRTHVFRTGVQFTCCEQGFRLVQPTSVRRCTTHNTRYHQSTYYLSPAKKRADVGTRTRWPDSSPSAAQRAPVSFKTTWPWD